MRDFQKGDVIEARVLCYNYFTVGKLYTVSRDEPAGSDYVYVAQADNGLETCWIAANFDLWLSADGKTGKALQPATTSNTTSHSHSLTTNQLTLSPAAAPRMAENVNDHSVPLGTQLMFFPDNNGNAPTGWRWITSANTELPSAPEPAISEAEARKERIWRALQGAAKQ